MNEMLEKRQENSLTYPDVEKCEFCPIDDSVLTYENCENCSFTYTPFPGEVDND